MGRVGVTHPASLAVGQAEGGSPQTEDAAGGHPLGLSREGEGAEEVDPVAMAEDLKNAMVEVSVLVPPVAMTAD